MTTATPSLRTESQPDANYFAAGLETASYFAGTPHEIQLEPGDPFPIVLTPPNVKDWDTLLKFSNHHGRTMTGLIVAQGKENALDVNNLSSNLNLEGEWGVEGHEGDQIWTVKGGSWGIKISGRAHSRGNRADFVAGLWSDQSFATTHDIDLSALSHATGRPLTVILCRVNSPWLAWVGRAPADIQLPVNARVLKLKSFGAFLHYWCKFSAVKVGLIKGRKA